MTMQIDKDIKTKTSITSASAAINKSSANQGKAGSTSSFGKVLEETMNCYRPDRRPVGRILTNQQIREDIMMEARTSPEDANRLAHSYAFNSLTMPLIDVTDRDNIRYSGNGELITAESSAYYTNTMLAMQRERIKLYRAEIEKGTPPVEILEKVLKFNDSLPPRFLDMGSW
jgi:7-cyano-7-deazaguanine synthase in queuosine biosynthesis